VTAVAAAGSGPTPQWTQGGSAITSYAYASIDAGQTEVTTFALNNSGGSATGALAISLDNTTGMAFKVTQDGCSGTSLGPNKSCSVTVQYGPASPGEADNATLTAAGKKHSATAALMLSGTAKKVIASPMLATTPGGTVVEGSGSRLTDSATLSGGSNPVGTITFYLFAPGVTPDATDGNNVYSDAVTVSGNGTYTTASGTNPGGYSPVSPGTYQWVAVYSGDPGNQGITGPFGSEPESVTPASPSLSTTAGGAVVLLSGSHLTDSANLSGGFNPMGTITFYLFAPGVTPDATDSNTVYSDTVTVTGNGMYSTAEGTNPGGYLPPLAGTYQWVAVYSGDTSNQGTASSFGDEPETVT
jgi:hypothetical protein